MFEVLVFLDLARVTRTASSKAVSAGGLTLSVAEGGTESICTTRVSTDVEGFVISARDLEGDAFCVFREAATVETSDLEGVAFCAFAAAVEAGGGPLEDPASSAESASSSLEDSEEARGACSSACTCVAEADDLRFSDAVG